MTKMSLYLACCLGLMILAGPVAAATIYVDVDSTCSTGCGGSWATAYPDLQDGIDAASAGDEVWVAEGNYYGTITLQSGVKVYGGFDGTEGSASTSNPDTNVTTIHGASGTRAVESLNSDGSTVLRGFQIMDGETPSLEGGGGILLSNSSTVFVRCRIRDNYSGYMGAGVGIYNGGSPRFVNCKFYHNDAELAGGAVMNWEGSPTFENCLFYENTGGDAGAVASQAGTATFVNCTLADNTATIGNGGALYDCRGAAVVNNCIFWNNVSTNYDTDEICNGTGQTTITYSDVKGGWPGTGNINAAPRFVNADADNYKLGGTFMNPSPCRNTGNGTLVPADVNDLDWDGNTTEQLPWDLTADTSRFFFGGVDMGAYEWTFEQQQQ